MQKHYNETIAQGNGVHTVRESKNWVTGGKPYL